MFRKCADADIQNEVSRSRSMDLVFVGSLSVGAEAVPTSGSGIVLGADARPSSGEAWMWPYSWSMPSAIAVVEIC
jgi:hypothetical protein